MTCSQESQTWFFSRIASASSLFADAMVRHFVQIESIDESRFHLRVKKTKGGPQHSTRKGNCFPFRLRLRLGGRWLSGMVKMFMFEKNEV